MGVLLAILAGIASNLGLILQKKVVNDHRDDAEFMKNLIKVPLWVIGLSIEFGIGTAFFMLAQYFIGPALIPGLMGAGLIVLAIGSVKIIGESLKKIEIIGIFLMILGIALLGFSELSIETEQINFIDTGFIIRILIFTVILSICASICFISQTKKEKLKGILFAILSGVMFALSNLWVFPLIGVIANVLEGTFVFEELILFVVSSILLILENIFGVWAIQQAFKFGQASNLIPIQQLPIQIAPLFIYYSVFLLIALSIFSIFYSVIGVTFIIISSFLLSGKQAQLEAIKKE